MALELRPITEDEHDRWNQVPFAGFSNVPPASEIAGWRARTEWDRTLVAIEDGDFVGTTAVNSDQMHVPGGAMVPTAGVSVQSQRHDHAVDPSPILSLLVRLVWSPLNHRIPMGRAEGARAGEHERERHECA